MSRWLLAIALLMPVALWAGLSRTSRVGEAPAVERFGTSFPASKLPLQQVVESLDGGRSPRITNLQITDLDQDGTPDLLICDALRDRVLWRRRGEDGSWKEEALADENDLSAPSHAHVVDLDEDGDLDIVVALLGSVWPTDGRVGSVILLEQVEEGDFQAVALLEDVRRVADAQSGDIDGDGDLDLVVAVFGYSMGQLLWLQNNDGKFRERQLLATPGSIHVPLADYDADGDLDIIALVSQDEESVLAFENLGEGEFAAPRRLFSTVNFDFGTSGLVPTDLDQDQDLDLLLVAGDSLEVEYHYPRPSHGCLWLENQGDWQFATHRIARLGGVYGAAVGDLDGDRDRDVVLVSMFNDWQQAGAASAVWLENDGQQQFTAWQLADDPIHLATVACGDLNGDGRDDIVAGGLHLFGSVERVANLAFWYSESTD